MSQLLQIPEKIYYKSFIRFHGIETCFCKKKYADTLTQVILYLDYPKFIHLGDMLWFEPVARLLAANFNLAVCCDRSMAFYYRGLGYNVMDRSSIHADDFLIARTELAYHLRGRNVLWINFNYINVCMPVINAVLKNIADYMGLPEMHDAKPRALDFSEDEKSSVAKKFGIDSRCNYLIFNNYIDSRGLRMKMSEFQKAVNTLRNYAVKYKLDNHFKLVHTGTVNNKQEDGLIQGIADLDLRGLTSVEDCFALASLENVITYVGFDTFWLHLFNIYDKSSHVVLRPGFSGKWKEQVRHYVAVPYQTEQINVRIIL